MHLLSDVNVLLIPPWLVFPQFICTPSKTLTLLGWQKQLLKVNTEPALTFATHGL